MCVMHAPNSFIIDADTGVAEVVPGGAARSSREALELAERMCPVHAISILVEGDG
jgi:ferredoxin